MSTARSRSPPTSSSRATASPRSLPPGSVITKAGDTVIPGRDRLLTPGLINAGRPSPTEIHPDFAEADAFLHNDPYLGNTHHADDAGERGGSLYGVVFSDAGGALVVDDAATRAQRGRAAAARRVSSG